MTRIIVHNHMPRGQRDAGFEESKHPRAPNGEFGKGSGGSSSSGPSFTDVARTLKEGGFRGGRLGPYADGIYSTLKKQEQPGHAGEKASGAHGAYEIAYHLRNQLKSKGLTPTPAQEAALKKLESHLPKGASKEGLGDH